MRVILFFSFLFSFNMAESQIGHGRLQVTSDGHYFQYEDGTPFFWLGDTGWDLFSQLTLEEIKKYLDNRSAKGFNVIQASVLPLSGLHTANRYGEIVSKDDDLLKPNEKYFSVMDSAIHLAQERNIFVALVATWGERVGKRGKDRVIISDSTSAYRYGNWIGNRYRKFRNIIWILGGDNSPIADSFNTIPLWHAMAQGIIDATAHKCLITYHPHGERSSSEWLQKESWMDFNAMQSSHGRHDMPVWKMVKKDRDNSPTKPTLDAEPNYEDHPVHPWPKWNADSGYFRDYDVRKQLYRSVFAGAAGVTYGHHAIWQFLSERNEIENFADRGWVNAMDRPGAYQAGYLRKLIESRQVIGRVPDNSMIISGQSELNSEHIETFRAADSSYGMIYLPIGKKIIVNTGFIKGKKISAWWFNPKDGLAKKEETRDKKDKLEFTPPILGFQNDWVLVIDDDERKYKTPAK